MDAARAGEGSLFALLKARGWASSLVSGESGASIQPASFFYVRWGDEVTGMHGVVCLAWAAPMPDGCGVGPSPLVPGVLREWGGVGPSPLVLGVLRALMPPANEASRPVQLCPRTLLAQHPPHPHPQQGGADGGGDAAR